MWRTKGCDCTVEVAGSDESIQIAWKITRPNDIISIVEMYEKNQEFPLPLMYGINLIFNQEELMLLIVII